MKNRTMKTKLTILFLLCLCTISAAGQGITRQKCATCGKLKVQCPYKGNHPVEKKCASCGKVISKCQYKGNHPKSMPEKACTSCGKVISNCPYRGKHPSKPSIISSPSGYENGYGYVELGLSVKWATTNVGASSPTDFGGYYAWGETRTKSKSSYDWSNYFDTNDSGKSFVKYTAKETNLDVSDDAAHVNWGGAWRMPTKAEQDELREKCTWTWTTQNGKKGYKVSSQSNGNSIFLPAAGQCGFGNLFDVGSVGFYLTSSRDASDSAKAHILYFYQDYVVWLSDSRVFGRSVRAVCP